MENEWKEALRERRFGKFSIPDMRIRNFPEEIQRFLSGVLVLSATFDYVSKRIEYLALSPLFEPVDDGLIAPEYLLIHYGGAGESIETKFGMIV